MQPEKSAATHANGEFRLRDVPVGRHTFEVTYTGYQTAILSGILVTSGKEAEVNIEMTRQNKQLNEIVVSGCCHPLSLLSR